MPLIQDVPMLTVYRSGLINLNAEATRLMHEEHLAVDLLPPAIRYAPWQLDRRAGCSCRLKKRDDRPGQYRFKAGYRADVLFQDQPASVKRIVFRITPNTHYLDLYTLAAELPITGQVARVQQKAAS